MTAPTRFPFQTDKIHRQSHHAGTVIKNLDYSFPAFPENSCLSLLVNGIVFLLILKCSFMTDCGADSEGCLFSCSWHLIKPHSLDWGIEWNVWSLTPCLPLEEGWLFASYTFYLLLYLSLSCFFPCCKQRRSHSRYPSETRKDLKTQEFDNLRNTQQVNARWCPRKLFTFIDSCQR